MVQVVMASDQWFLGVSRQMILAQLARQDDIVDVNIDSWPVNS